MHCTPGLTNYITSIVIKDPKKKGTYTLKPGSVVNTARSRDMEPVGLWAKIQQTKIAVTKI